MVLRTDIVLLFVTVRLKNESWVGHLLDEGVEQDNPLVFKEPGAGSRDRGMEKSPSKCKSGKWSLRFTSPITSSLVLYFRVYGLTLHHVGAGARGLERVAREVITQGTVRHNIAIERFTCTNYPQNTTLKKCTTMIIKGTDD